MEGHPKSRIKGLLYMTPTHSRGWGQGWGWTTMGGFMG